MSSITKKIGFHLMRQIRSRSFRNKLIDIQAKRIGQKDIPKGIGKPLNIDVEDLNTKGYLNIGQLLSNDEVASIQSEIKDFTCFDPFRKQLGDFNILEAPKQVSVANYKRSDLATLKSILDIANNTNILEVVSSFLGATPTISNINMWWSLSSKEKAEQAQLFHRDVDDFKFCKLFIYLTDVDMESGPHVYVKGSSVSNSLLKIRRYNDAEIETAFGKDNITYFTAPKGSSFMVNTYGFHKGLLPKKNNRLLMQIQYSLNPIGIENYAPVDIGNHPYDAYINRLILK